MKKLLMGLVLSSFLIFGVACSSPDTATTTSSTKVEDKVAATATITLIEDDKEVTSKEISFTEGDTVLEALKANFDVKENSGFVTEIDGKSQDEKASKYWMYYVNNKEAEKGADSIEVAPGDTIEWRLNEFK